jgi:hypothetical protein
MQRDLELIRSMLLFIERVSAPGFLLASKIGIDGYFSHETAYHAGLLLDAGYIRAEPVKCCGTSHTDYRIERLTNQGHDYLDSVRDDRVWTKTKATLGDAAKSAPLRVVESVAVGFVKSLLGI